MDSSEELPSVVPVLPAFSNGKYLPRDSAEDKSPGTPSTVDEEIPPNPTIVIKNLPYDSDIDLLEEQIRGLGDGTLPIKSFAPYNDAEGKFLGLVFINYRSLEDAIKAHGYLKEAQIGSRRTRIEYRRLKPGERPPREKKSPRTTTRPKRNTEENWRTQKRPPFEEPKLSKEAKAEQYEEQVRQYTEVLSEFINNPEETYYEFSSTLSSFHRRAVHDAAENLELGHRSSENQEGKRVIKITKDQELRQVWKEEEAKRLSSKALSRDSMEQDLDAIGQKYMKILTEFKERPDEEGLDYAFPTELQFPERRRIHRIAEKLGLGHRVVENEDEEKYMCCTKDPVKIEMFRQLEEDWKKQKEADRKSGDGESSRGGRRAKKPSKRPEEKTLEPLSAEQLSKYKMTKPRSQWKEGDSDVGFLSSPTIKRYVPPRQPKGPLDSHGFQGRMEYWAISKPDDAELVNESERLPTEDQAEGIIDETEGVNDAPLAAQN
uniref:R3H domain-containing protein n=1 Tax=Rhodosorus marinus TaxID=101924 RepID=A0A7S3EFQ9_9RHOD|mmetsp:Transcript_32859/g.129048  ORF Transcript_32859/g.129048 Transcript_32859/m.129048 type:complete len:489 (+) Transcript_32859:679-2145(+)|eukprot:CAMPEP_0113966672 /NCGR_PEP_ID=MMETSP0011_2-20120614/8452_1 /TAXON_ID=101924 /ORGANISM="Rhodosorus marinus" /LENGTH=488 /DNA_ID=CAMNT_0000979365 /DNA_START=610 /DNA_END=2076 /DNA_ORIENTATION=+ /assembly_acc=CAM_ASM_000156